MSHNPIEIIYMNRHTVTCCICGKEDLNHWGVPIDTQTALICSNDHQGDWAALPACQECWAKHDQGQYIGQDPQY